MTKEITTPNGKKVKFTKWDGKPLGVWLLEHKSNQLIRASDTMSENSGWKSHSRYKTASQWYNDKELRRIKDALGYPLIEAHYSDFKPMENETVVGAFMPDDKAEYRNYMFFSVEKRKPKEEHESAEKWRELLRLQQEDPDEFYRVISEMGEDEVRELRKKAKPKSFMG